MGKFVLGFLLACTLTARADYDDHFSRMVRALERIAHAVEKCR